MSDAYPVKSVRIIVPLPMGGPADILARAIAKKLTLKWGQEVVVDNLLGNDTLDGCLAVAKADPDGYTFLVVPSQLTVHPRQRTSMPYDVVKDFTPVIMMALGPNVFVAQSDVAVENIQDVVALAKKNPGKLKCATGGLGSTSQRLAEKFVEAAGIDVQIVPYKGAAPAMTAALAHETEILFSVMAPAVPQIQSGKLKALAVTGPVRSKILPQTPTVREAGFAVLEIATWQGMFGPANMDVGQVAWLNSEVSGVLKLPDIQSQLAALGFELAASTPAEFAEHIKKEIQTPL